MTSYEMRMSDWSSYVCSSDLNAVAAGEATNATGAGASAFGGGANAIADNATALGFNALAAGDSSTAAGGELHYKYYDAALMEDVTIEGTNAANGIGATPTGARAQAHGALTHQTGRQR